MDRTVTIVAKWEKRPEDVCAEDTLFLMAGEACLGYVMLPTNVGQQFIPCVGTGIDAPAIGSYETLEGAQAALEAEFRPDLMDDRPPAPDVTGRQRRVD